MITNFVLLAAEGDPNAGMMNLILIVVLIAIFYFFMIRPQQKKQKEIRKFREGIKVGDTVVTAGGIYGKVSRVKPNYFSIEVAKGIDIDVDRNSVYPSANHIENAAEAAK